VYSEKSEKSQKLLFWTFVILVAMIAILPYFSMHPSIKADVEIVDPKMENLKVLEGYSEKK